MSSKSAHRAVLLRELIVGYATAGDGVLPLLRVHACKTCMSHPPPEIVHVHIMQGMLTQRVFGELRDGLKRSFAVVLLLQRWYTPFNVLSRMQVGNGG